MTPTNIIKPAIPLFLGAILLGEFFCPSSASAQEEREQLRRMTLMGKRTRPFPTKSFRKMKFSPYGAMSYGHQSNVFNSPEAVVNSVSRGTVSGLEKSDSFYEGEAGFKEKARLGKNDLLRLSYAFDTIQFSSYSVLDETSHKVRTSYRHRFNKNWQAGIRFSFKAKDMTATNIFGERLSQEFSYRQWRFGPEITFVLPRNGRSGSVRGGLFGKSVFRVVYLYNSRDYKSPALASTRGLDYNARELIAGLSQTVAKTHRVTVKFTRKDKDYRDQLAKLAATGSVGQSNTSGIKRQQTDTIIGLFWKWIPAKTGSRFRLGYQHHERNDPFQDYYGYSKNKVFARARKKFHTGTNVYVQTAYEKRDYKVLDVPLAGPNPKLEMKKYIFTLGLSQKFLKRFRAKVKYQREKRDTNKISSSSSSRDYTDSIWLMGLSARW